MLEVEATQLLAGHVTKLGILLVTVTHYDASLVVPLVINPKFVQVQEDNP